MDIFWDAAKDKSSKEPGKLKVFNSKAYALMSHNYRSVFEEDMKAIPVPDYSRLKLVVDHVCGMTDNYATSLHKELLGD